MFYYKHPRESLKTRVLDILKTGYTNSLVREQKIFVIQPITRNTDMYLNIFVSVIHSVIDYILLY